MSVHEAMRLAGRRGNEEGFRQIEGFRAISESRQQSCQASRMSASSSTTATIFFGDEDTESSEIAATVWLARLLFVWVSAMCRLGALFCNGEAA